MKNKVWIDASEWLEAYNGKQLNEWYQDKKKYQKKQIKRQDRLNKNGKKKTIKSNKK